VAPRHCLIAVFEAGRGHLRQSQAAARMPATHRGLLAAGCMTLQFNLSHRPQHPEPWLPLDALHLPEQPIGDEWGNADDIERSVQVDHYQGTTPLAGVEVT
jgi:hypothetical protein